MADIKWIKITTDIFDDEKILLIESMPDADALIVIWFKLLCMAGKQNNSGVFTLNDKIVYTDEMLATIFRRPVNTVRLALSTFEAYGMVELVDGIITIPNWEKHQNIDGLERIRESTRQRVARHREKQLALTDNCNVTSNVTVTPCNALDKDKIRIDKNKEYIAEIISYLNSVCGTHYKDTSAKTVACINARLKEGYTVDNFKTVIDKKYKNWHSNEMAQYLRPETLFGNKFESYLNELDTEPKKPKNSPNFEGRKIDFEALEKIV